MDYQVCENCGWSGHESELVCSEEDNKSKKPVNEIAFNLCPNCGSDDVIDYDNED